MRNIDPTDRTLRPLSSYAERLPSSRPGKRLNRATLWRWALKGHGGKVLRTVQLGAGRFTCDAWVAEFMEPGPQPPPLARSELTPTERERIERRFARAAAGEHQA